MSFEGYAYLDKNQGEYCYTWKYVRNIYLPIKNYNYLGIEKKYIHNAIVQCSHNNIRKYKIIFGIQNFIVKHLKVRSTK